MAYRTGSYAWTQVAMLGLLVAGQHLRFARSSDPTDLLDALGDGVTAVSSTPSLWRWLLTCAPAERLRSLGLAQITLGGEAADQPLLDWLRSAFPDARITHVYASTECGVVMACSDGLAGFPASVLARRPDDRAPAVELRDGTLRVRSPYGVAGGEAWVDTRDLAELVDGRLHVRGRAGHGTINVGGQLVRLEELEAFVHELPDVAWARAYPVRSALVGSLVGLEVVLAPECARSEGEAERDIRGACRRALGEQCEPRVVRFLTEPALAPSLKRAAG
jgi:acyl-CoA synthetase (AMP-forming)/AMP-acid ligase II